jgi:predicted transcriptional regulator of viral defense system
MSPRNTRFSIAKADITSFFDALQSHVLTRSEIAAILDDNRSFWRLSTKTTVSRFIEDLSESAKLGEVVLSFPGKRHIRYTWGDASTYEIAQSISPRSHFSHYSAVFLHGLTEQLPKSIFVKIELPHESKPSSSVDQTKLQLAFSNMQRISKNFATLGDTRIYVLYGKKSNNLGVEIMDTPYGRSLRCTNLERTLIDIAVRPSYSGGISEVLKAYINARSLVSVNRMVAYLKTLDFSYPYHQAIGFYMDRAGEYSGTQINLVRDLGIERDFYLDYNMKETEYVKAWRLFVPRRFQRSA